MQSLNSNSRKTSSGHGVLLELTAFLVLTLACAAFAVFAPRLGAPGWTKGRWSEWYLRSEQWRADAQTVVAAVRFLLEPEKTLPISSLSDTNWAGLGEGSDIARLRKPDPS
jgi:hypothetical protein